MFSKVWICNKKKKACPLNIIVPKLKKNGADKHKWVGKYLFCKVISLVSEIKLIYFSCIVKNNEWHYKAKIDKLNTKMYFLLPTKSIQQYFLGGESLLICLAVRLSLSQLYLMLKPTVSLVNSVKHLVENNKEI